MARLAFRHSPLRIPYSHHRAHPSSKPRACSNDVSPPLTPPTTLDQTLTLAATSLDKALSTGVKRANLTALIPGLNPLIEETVPYSDSLLNNLSYSLTHRSTALSSSPSVALLFKSAGTAAAARVQYPDNDDARVQFSSYFRRDASAGGSVSPHANIIIHPISSRGDRVMDDLEAIIECAPDASWILLNADFGIDRAAVGMRELARRDRFLNSFVNVFYFRNLFEIRRPQLIPVERGALLHVYNAAWTVFALLEKGYIVAAQYDTPPDAEDISTSVRRAIASMRTIERTSQAGVDNEFLRVLALCAGAFASVYIAFYISSHA